MKKISVAAALCFAVVACDAVPDRLIFEEPSNLALSGAWTGVEEITTDNDITSNINFPGTTGGFSFPVVLQFEGGNRFTLFTSNYATSSSNDQARTCSGVFTRSNATIKFFPAQECRALPMNKFTLGRTLPSGITLEARTNTSGDVMASYASVHVRFNLERE